MYIFILSKISDGSVLAFVLFSNCNFVFKILFLDYLIDQKQLIKNIIFLGYPTDSNRKYW